MNHLHDEESWTSSFGVTQADLDRAAGQLEQAVVPQDLKALALAILQERLKEGQAGPALPRGSHGRPHLRVWDPAGEWQPGDAVLVVIDRFGNSKYEILPGEVVYLDQDRAEIRVEGLQDSRTYLRALPGSENGRKPGLDVETWRALVCELVDKKLRSGDPMEEAEGILLRYGETILSCLAQALQQDPRFADLEGKWYLRTRLPHIEKESLQAVHHFLLHNGPAALDDILPVLVETWRLEPCLVKMAVHTTLTESPGRFENIGTFARPRWRALLPAHDRAAVTHFAFDPQTFELLCSPGQRLSQKKAQRLQELDLYAHVVTFPEWQPATRP